MTVPEPPQKFAAERWFLREGLPSVLRPGVLVRRVWPRSAPALAALAVFMTNSVVLVALTGKHSIDIDGTPTRTEWFVLALVVLVLPLAALAGWLVSRIETFRARILASSIAFLVAAAGAVVGGPSPYVFANLLLVAEIVIVILVCTVTGLGSVLGWAVRITATNLAAVGSMFVRALPVVLLTVLVFFNSYVWLMAAIVSRARLWVALVFLFAIAAAFLISSTLERVRPILVPSAKSAEDDARLAGTPFADLPDRPRRVPLSRSETANVVFIVGLSQIVQVLTVALGTAGIFFVLGLILLSPQLLSEWTRNSRTDGEILGMTLPVPQALIQITLFLGAMTFMYLSARAVTEAERRFLDPIIDDLRLTLVARDRYRTYTAGEQKTPD